MDEFAYRHPKKSDAQRILSIRNGSREELPEHRTETLEELSSDIFNPDYDPKGSWIAFNAGSPVGYAVGLVESPRIKQGRMEARLDIEVLPHLRGTRIGKGLLERVVGYSRSRGMKSILTRCEPGEKWKRELLEDLGFKVVHHWYRMKREGGSRPERRPVPPGFNLACKMLKDFSDDEIDRLVSVSNSAFSDVFDFFPVATKDMIRFRDTCLDIERIAWVEKDGQMTGFCVSEESASYNKEHGSRMGYILILCVLKEYRGRGIGAALLTEGLHWVLDRGMDNIYLAVDAENRNALSLYTSVGFSILREGAFYRATL